MPSINIYCTYLTTYIGNKLPPFYIGSSSLDKISKGYRGSVSSKKWKKIFKEELKKFPEKFKIEIVNTFNTRTEALIDELELQRANDVVKSKWFFNEALATVNGFFGSSQLGVKKAESTKAKMRGNKNSAGNHKPKTLEHRLAMSLATRKPAPNRGANISVSKKARCCMWMNNGVVAAQIPLSLINEAYSQNWIKGRKVADNLVISY